MKRTANRQFSSSASIKAIVLLVLVSLSYVFIPIKSVFAIPLPLPPNECYQRTNGDFVPQDCPAGVTPVSGRCVSIIASARGTTYNDIDCENGNTAGQINPSIETPGSSQAGPAVEDEEDAVLNACDASNPDCERQKCESEELTADNCGIIAYLVLAINVLSVFAGMAIIGSIMFAGFQYMTAKDNSGQVEAARKRITWAIVALAIFIFMYAVLNFLVPGGLL